MSGPNYHAWVTHIQRLSQLRAGPAYLWPLPQHAGTPQPPQPWQIALRNDVANLTSPWIYSAQDAAPLNCPDYWPDPPYLWTNLPRPPHVPERLLHKVPDAGPPWEFQFKHPAHVEHLPAFLEGIDVFAVLNMGPTRDTPPLAKVQAYFEAAVSGGWRLTRTTPWRNAPYPTGRHLILAYDWLTAGPLPNGTHRAALLWQLTPPDWVPRWGRQLSGYPQFSLPNLNAANEFDISTIEGAFPPPGHPQPPAPTWNRRRKAWNWRTPANQCPNIGPGTADVVLSAAANWGWIVIGFHRFPLPPGGQERKRDYAIEATTNGNGAMRLRYLRQQGLPHNGDSRGRYMDCIGRVLPDPPPHQIRTVLNHQDGCPARRNRLARIILVGGFAGLRLRTLAARVHMEKSISYR